MSIKYAHLDSTTEAMHSAPVAAKLAAVARELEARANSVGSSEGVDMSITIETGVRPKGRPYAYVVSSNVAQEYGNLWTDRHRILGRVAEMMR